MTDLPSRLADRRCPECGTLQPLYTSRGWGMSLQRGQEALPCPGCGTLLRLEPDSRDPGGLKAAAIMVVMLCAVIFGGIALGMGWGLSEAAIGWLIGVLVAAGIVAAVLWNGYAAQRRKFVPLRTSDKDDKR